MAFFIDLNETPISSPREADVGPSGGILVCAVCKKGVPGGRRNGPASEEWKCFRCLLKTGGNGGGEGGGGGGVGFLDINASPPREVEAEVERNFVDLTNHVAATARQDRERNHGGGGKIQTLFDTYFSGHRIKTTFPSSLCVDKGYNLLKSSRVATDTDKSGFEDAVQRRTHFEGNSDKVHLGSTFDRSVRTSHFDLFNSLQSSNMVYLQTLREYISERNGVLGEGWSVEFEYCEKNCKTFAVYIAPDGSRLKSMDDVACHLGLPPSYHCVETENRYNEFSFSQNGLQSDRTTQETSGSLTAKNCGPSQSIQRSSTNSRGFLSGLETKDSLDMNNSKSMRELGFAEDGGSGICGHDGFPMQFEDFYLISAGNVDQRPSYRNTNQIWPVGYRSIWHDKITGSLFVCDVADGGESGPIFKVQRYPCTTQSIPIGSTILSRPKLGSCEGEDKMKKDGLATMQVIDDESTFIQMMLNEDVPPCLDDEISISNRANEFCHSQEANFSILELECLPQRSGNLAGGILGLKDIIGEFRVEGRSSSSVWEMVSHSFLRACQENYKQNGAVHFFCNHDADGTDTEYLENIDSLSKFSSLAGPIHIPQSIRSDNEFNTACGMLMTWLKQDRFGLDAEFVQEIIELLPGITACSGYATLNDRKHISGLQTVGSGFLQAKKKSDTQGKRESNCSFGSSKKPRLQLHDSEDKVIWDPCPPGKPLSSRLPAYLMGDALQVWELSWHFEEVLGLGEPFSFQELESELIKPWSDSLYWLENSGNETQDTGDATPYGRDGEVSQVGVACLSRCTGLILAKTHVSLLKLLSSALLSKVIVYVCPKFDSGESKSRRGRKKDSDGSTASKKSKLDMLPINELTWPEIARRYILAVLSMEGNLDSAEIASRESGKVFHCLQGDGGTLCGSLTGMAALEADAVLLADTMKQIFGSSKSKSELISIYEKETDPVGASKMIELNDGVIPEWVQVLEPVRKLPTNVGARIRRCVNEALERNPPEWAKIRLEQSISKEVYKGNASGPTKRAVISVLDNVSSGNLQQKPEKKEKIKSTTSLSDLIMKQCRFVLRHAAAADEDEVFCNLLGRTFLNPNDNDDEGLLGYPAMVSRPLDFRTIDLRLAFGAYCGSHEAFMDDVREVWHNIRTAYGERSDLSDLVDNLSQKFEDLYDKEVLALVHKIVEFDHVNCSSGDAIKERDDLLAHVSESSLPRAPWDEGICKVCGMDKDDDNVLLCDRCDSEYHRYCLNPPLLRIPEGNWYCPSCAAGQSTSRTVGYGSAVNQFCKRRHCGEFTHKFLEKLAQLANLMTIREYWDFSVEERIFLMKFLFDEALSASTIHDHIDQCASRNTELLQKLRSLTSEWKMLKSKEEMSAANTEKVNTSIGSGRGDLESDALVSVLGNENYYIEKPSERGSHISSSGGFMQLENVQNFHGQSDYSKQPCWPPSRSILENNSTFPGDQIMNDLGALSHQLQYQQPVSEHTQLKRDNLDAHLGLKVASRQNELPMSTQQHTSVQKNDVSRLQDSIASIELELLKGSLRKHFLGRDSNGRVYWGFSWPGTHSCIVANGGLASKKRSPEEFSDIPDSATWMSYESQSEIEKLVGWMREDNERERELKESIVQWQNNESKDSNYAENHVLNKGESSIFCRRKALPPDVLATKAMTALKKKFGPCLEMETIDVHTNLTPGVGLDGKMYRCECLELLWPSRDHCLSCHQSFATSEESRQHSVGKCKTRASDLKRGQITEDSLKRKKMRNVMSQDKFSGNMIVQKSVSEGHYDRSRPVEHHNKLECPFNFEEIKARFVTQNSLKELVKDVGLIGTGGTLPFLPIESFYLGDPTLKLVPARENEVSSREMQADLGSWLQQSGIEPGILDGMKNNKKKISLPRTVENDLGEGSKIERVKSVFISEKDEVSSIKVKRPVLGVSVSRGSIISEASTRPLGGKASEILRYLKINLLDMDAALPEEALRVSRSHLDRRCAWRAFVKSAKTIYEMIQATIALEDTIKSEYLRSDWWYWSSPSTAARTSTVSALALRIYALDSAIFYEKPSSEGATDIPMPDCIADKGTAQDSIARPSSPSVQKTPDSNAIENPRTRSRTSKRRKDSSA
ncbi:Methyl-CpG-binding domain-containing protein 9 [Forsythia ovata]|uniref:Methyl-CpG-binding domain-containing protein 9 n=1 Tax=Forsythia ovata TaxID=205694 RepID=A0ABD1XDI8_9LAMI